MSLLGKIAYKYYYGPKNIKDLKQKFGGKQNYALMLDCEEDMKSYALKKLSIRYKYGEGPIILNYLTGSKFIHQSLFCLYSLFKTLEVNETEKFSVRFYDDGSLTDEIKSLLHKRHPNLQVISFSESMNNVNKELPIQSFPNIHRKIKNFPLIKKLIFVHLGKTGINTFLDSDMLFFKRPQELLDWLYTGNNETDAAFCIEDIQRSYGYSDQVINTVYPIGIKRNINSGLTCINSESINFEDIDRLIFQFEKLAGSTYYLEQLITAILLEKTNLYIGAKSQYIVLPTREQVLNQLGTLHHYVDTSKEWYFKIAWKALL